MKIFINWLKIHTHLWESHILYTHICSLILSFFSTLFHAQAPFSLLRLLYSNGREIVWYKPMCQIKGTTKRLQAIPLSFSLLFLILKTVSSFNSHIMQVDKETPKHAWPQLSSYVRYLLQSSLHQLMHQASHVL